MYSGIQSTWLLSSEVILYSLTVVIKLHDYVLGVLFSWSSSSWVILYSLKVVIKLHDYLLGNNVLLIIIQLGDPVQSHCSN